MIHSMKTWPFFIYIIVHFTPFFYHVFNPFLVIIPPWIGITEITVYMTESAFKLFLKISSGHVKGQQTIRRFAEFSCNIHNGNHG